MTDHDRRPQDPADDEPAGERWPVGFILIVVAAVLYLAVRAWQGIRLLVDWLGG